MKHSYSARYSESFQWGSGRSGSTVNLTGTLHIEGLYQIWSHLSSNGSLHLWSEPFGSKWQNLLFIEEKSGVWVKLVRIDTTWCLISFYPRTEQNVQFNFVAFRWSPWHELRLSFTRINVALCVVSFSGMIVVVVGVAVFGVVVVVAVSEGSDAAKRRPR